MGVKVDRNARVVPDLQAIWLFCSRLDLSKNHRDLATATFKAQLVTETPAIEMEKKCVFEHDRSFETLDQFLGFEKITLQIGPPMSITWNPLVKNLEAKTHGSFFGEKSPMAPPASRCSSALQSRSSAVKRAGFDRESVDNLDQAMQAVANITRAGSGRLTSSPTLGLDSNATMKAADFGSLLADLLCILRARFKCRRFSEVPGVRTSCILPILRKARNLSEVSSKNSSVTLHASRFSFALQSRSSAVESEGFTQVCLKTMSLSSPGAEAWHVFF
eukprot:s365_g14.t1